MNMPEIMRANKNKEKLWNCKYWKSEIKQYENSSCTDADAAWTAETEYFKDPASELEKKWCQLCVDKLSMLHLPSIALIDSHQCLWRCSSPTFMSKCNANDASVLQSHKW